MPPSLSDSLFWWWPATDWLVPKLAPGMVQALSLGSGAAT